MSLPPASQSGEHYKRVFDNTPLAAAFVQLEHIFPDGLTDSAYDRVDRPVRIGGEVSGGIGIGNICKNPRFGGRLLSEHREEPCDREKPHSLRHWDDTTYEPHPANTFQHTNRYSPFTGLRSR